MLSIYYILESDWCVIRPRLTLRGRGRSGGRGGRGAVYPVVAVDKLTRDPADRVLAVVTRDKHLHVLIVASVLGLGAEQVHRVAVVQSVEGILVVARVRAQVGIGPSGATGRDLALVNGAVAGLSGDGEAGRGNNVGELHLGLVLRVGCFGVSR